MKLTQTCATILLLMLTWGCDGEGLDTFTITESAEAVVPAGSIVEVLASDLPFGDAFLNFDISNNQQFQNQGVKKSQIDSVTLTSLRLTVTNPQDGDLSFLQSLRFDVNSEGLPGVEVARGGPFPANQGEVNLTLTGAEMRDYVAAPSMALTTVASGKRPKEETKITATVTLKVDVNLSGLLD